MDNNSKTFQAFARLHSGLPRQGPGSTATTLQALQLLPEIPNPARIYDMGCGPGRASIVLARALKQKIVCLDLCQEFLLELQHVAKEQGISDLIETRRADMATLDELNDSVDLIWAEGAIYTAGFDRALSLWRPHLKRSGIVSCTELSWIKAEHSKTAVDFWQAEYPGMRSVAQNIAAAEGLGYACLNHFTLPQQCWWDEYYDPMLQKIDRLKDDATRDEALAFVLANSGAEIDLYRRFGHEYGYVFYLLQNSDVRIERAQRDDAAEIARMFRQSFQSALPFLPELHTAQEDLQYFTEKVLPNNNVFVARSTDNQIVGFISFDDSWVNHLYILPDHGRLGIGSRLLSIAKASCEKLRLWTFQKNETARRFYSKHGFTVIDETDGTHNDEREPDVLFAWNRNGEIPGEP